MVLGIDASNIRSGGGVTHLVELLNSAKPEQYGFAKVIVWGNKATLSQIKDRSWLTKENPALLEKNLLFRLYWQRFVLTKVAKAYDCNILFVPGGSFSSGFRPIVTMSQNLLPFEWKETRRYGFSWLTLKFLVLRFAQTRSFKRANGVIFLSEYALLQTLKVIGNKLENTITIPHGLNRRFFHPPKKQQPLNLYSSNNPLRILYVSIVDHYKHQWQVVEAVSLLVKEGYPVVLDLVGPANPKALKRLNKVIDEFDPAGSWVKYHGAIPYTELHQRYNQADIGLFASSCENMPNILLEMMSAGIPIASSNKGPMPEVLKHAGEYFDPEEPEEITLALRKLINSYELRQELAGKSYQLAQNYSWERCADETFGFLAEIAKGQTNMSKQ